MQEIKSKLAQLSPEKRAQLLKKLAAAKQQKITTVPIVAGISKLTELEQIPLSFAQQRLWFLAGYMDRPGIYNIPIFVKLHGHLNLNALERALTEIIRRHEILRTRFYERDGQIYQQILAAQKYSIEVEDLQSLNNKESYLQRQLQNMAVTEFDLIHGPLLVMRLYKLAEQEHVFATCAHHIITDGWSNQIFMREFSQLYNAFCLGRRANLTPLSRQYADYAAWQQQQHKSPEWQKHLNFWQDSLNDLPALLELPLEFPRPAEKQYQGENYVFSLDDGHVGLTQEIKKIAVRQQVSPFIFTLSIYALLLYRYSGQTDFAIGTPVANREFIELEPLIGFFVNTLPIRAQCSAKMTFLELLQQIRKRFFEASNHQQVAFEQIVDRIQPQRNESFTPIFQVMFSYVSAQSSATKLQDLDLEILAWEQHSAKFDLSLTLEERDNNHLVGMIEFDHNLFSTQRIKRLAEHFQNLLKEVIQRLSNTPSINPFVADSVLQNTLQLQNLDYLSVHEVQHYTQTWNDCSRTLPESNNVVAVFENQVRRTPHAIAIRQHDKTINYAELNRRANQLAHFLYAQDLHGQVVAAEDLISLYMQRSIDTIVAAIAILKLGAAYLPLDLAYPIERLKAMRDDAASRIILTQTSLIETAKAFGHECQVIALDNLQLDCYSEQNINHEITPNQLAYVIYTSGSTGVPKGVAVSHEAINGLVINSNYVQIETEDRIAQASNSAFDAATFEIWGALLNGARIVIVERETSLTPDRFAEFLEKQKISILFLTTALFNQVIQQYPTAFAQLRYLLFGGEAVDPGRVQIALREGKPKHLLHVYGPTETTTYASWYEIEEVFEDADTIPIGLPLSNNRLYVLDNQLNPVPPGVSGELYIGDSGLARGYLRRPGMSAEKFVPDPYAVKIGARMYRTGDVVRRTETGDIEFIGRADQQVKIRGFRIELGEIEAAICGDELIQQASVVVNQHSARGKHLLAYFSLKKSDSEFFQEELRKRIKQALPEYMQPVAYQQVDVIPLNPNGKVDKQALPPMTSENYYQEVSQAPETKTEQKLATIWQKLLAVDIYKQSDFFQSGGHSLLAMQLMARVQSEFSVKISVREIFSQSRLWQLAKLIEQRQTSKAEAAELHIPRAESLADCPSSFPLSFAQERMYFLQQLYENGSAYNMCAAFKLTGRLNRDALQSSLNRIVQRHSVLRTVFVMQNGQPRQVVVDEHKLQIKQQDLSHLKAQPQQQAIDEIIAAESRAVFYLDQLPLIRITLLQLQDNGTDSECILIVANHHILSDGWSQGIFMRELIGAYMQFNPNNSDDNYSELLPELSIQYKDYALWQRQYLNSERLQELLDYWCKQLADFPPALDLHADYSRPAQESFAGEAVTFTIESDTYKRLKRLAEAHQCSTYTVLLAGIKVFLARYSGQQDIAIGTPIANRGNKEIEGLIGFFVNTLVMRQKIQGNPSFKKFLEMVNQTVLDAFEHQEMPFEKLVEALQPERNLSGSPLFQMMFIYQNASDEQLQLPGIEIEPIPIDGNEAKFDLLLAMQDHEQQLHATLEYKSSLFTHASIEKIIDCFSYLLQQISRYPDYAIGEYQLLSPDAYQQQVYAWNQSALEMDSELDLRQMFQQTAEHCSQQIAVEYHQQNVCYELSYNELHQRSSYLAQVLIGKGVGPECLIGICMQRKPDLIVAILAVIKTGAAYVPLDPDYPSARIEQTLMDANVLFLLTEVELAEQYASIQQVESLFIDRILQIEQIPSEPIILPVININAENLAYLLYTSGSTGRPKGVAITQRSVLAFIAWAKTVYSPERLKQVLAGTSICFDLSIFEIFVTLAVGGRIILMRNVLALAENPQVKPSLINTVPSAVDELLRANALPDSVKTVNLAGEPLATELVNRLYAKPHIEKVYDLYGPSEDTTYSTYTLRLAKHAASIGHAIDNTQTYVLDKYLQPTPIGIPGELYIGGFGLARGYHRRPGLTADKFVPDPFSLLAGARMYRTGDLVCANAQGELKYIGRLDHQVKVRGFRIELGEIESLFCSHPQVEECVVITAGDAAATDRHLVAYIKSTQLANPEQSEEERQKVADKLEQNLFNICLERLPHFMKPAAMIILASFPLTPNGKIDRKALPKPTQHLKARRGIEPIGYIQNTLAALWREILNLDEKIFVDDNFFDLGGHSLLVLDLMTQIKVSLGRSLPLTAIFKAPTIGSLAALLSEQNQTDEWSPIVPLKAAESSHNHAPCAGLFCIHPVGGHVICYNELARHSSANQNIYGIRASGMESQQTIFKNIDMMSEYYYQEIKKIQPDGPYRLLGYSFGGLLAHQLATKLEYHGDKVEQLLLLDTAHPRITQEKTAETDSAELLVSLFSALDLDVEYLRRLSKAEQLNTVFKQAKLAGLVPRAMSKEAIERYFDVCHSNLLMSYEPQPINAKISLIRARDGAQRVSDDRYLGWNSAMEKQMPINIDLAWVDGKHENMLENPNVEQIAQLIKLID